MTTGRVEVRPATVGATVRLRVKPGARRTRLVGPHGGALKLEVVAAPEKGKANRAVQLLVSDRLGMKASHVRIVAGEASQDKVIEIDADPSDVAARLREAGIDARVS